MPSSVAAPNVAHHAGADRRQVPALEAPAPCPRRTQSALDGDDGSNELFPTEPI